MSSRDRVLDAASRRTPERVPVFSPNMMNTREAYDPKLIDFLKTFEFDELAVAGAVTNAPSVQSETGKDQFVDGYGCRFSYMGVGLPYCTFSPLEGAESVREVEEYPWPDAADLAVEAHETAAGFATAVYIPPLFHHYHYLRGFERWMFDIKENPAVHQAIAERIGHINLASVMRVLEKVGSRTDVVSTGDDFGWSKAPYMSPEDFRRLVKPHYRALVSAIKSKYPHIKFYLHSHGQIMDLVPDLIECGVDILNPVLPLDNMDPIKLKREYGNHLCFHGGIDVEEIVPFGSLEQVRDHVKRTIGILGEGGGYWFKLQVISPMIPPENIIAAYELAWDLG